MKNGLSYTELKSTVKPLQPSDKWNDVLTQLHGLNDGAHVIIRTDNRTLFGCKKGDGFHFPGDAIPDFKTVRSVRVFNDTTEASFWRSGAGLSGRLRIDGEGEAIPVVQCDMILFGTSSQLQGDALLLTEDRGTELLLPLTQFTVDAGMNRVAIRTHHYVGYMPNGQATYIDCRCVHYIQKTKDQEVHNG